MAIYVGSHSGMIHLWNGPSFVSFIFFLQWNPYFMTKPSLPFLEWPLFIYFVRIRESLAYCSVVLHSILHPFHLHCCGIPSFKISWRFNLYLGSNNFNEGGRHAIFISHFCHYFAFITDSYSVFGIIHSLVLSFSRTIKRPKA